MYHIRTNIIDDDEATRKEPSPHAVGQLRYSWSIIVDIDNLRNYDLEAGS